MAEVNNKYKGIDEKIAKTLESYEILYFREDKPVPFCGLKIYPVKVRDYEVFCNCSSCCTLNRKTTKEGLRMNNLEFLLLQTTKEGDEGQLWSYRIQKLFELMFHLENGVKCKNPECNHLISYESSEFLKFVQDIQKAQQNKQEFPQLICPKCGGSEFMEMIKFTQNPETKKYNLEVDGHIIMSNDFDLFRQIVLFQNLPDYHDDSWVDPALKQDYEARLELQRKKNDVQATLEQKVIGLSINTNYKFEEIFDMTIRKFTMALAMVDDLINYKIMKQASMSGFVSLPKDFKLEHWLYKSEKDMYGDAYKDMDDLKKEVSNL